MNRHFVTTWPRKTTCPQCQQLVIDGLEEGIPYRITPAPLTPTGELHAALTGRNTYRLLANHIVRRTPENITADTPQTRPVVYATHTCNPTNPAHISIDHITETQRFLTDKYIALEKATPEQDTTQQALITINDVLASRVIDSPDDELPPF